MRAEQLLTANEVSAHLNVAGWPSRLGESSDGESSKVAAKSNGVVETGRRPFGAASTKTLDQVVWGRVHVVTSTDGGDALEMRLMELGFVPGAPVAVRGAAPLGDPLEVEIHHVRLSMRRSEARRIRVRDNEG